jgi:hypothetical protein
LLYETARARLRNHANLNSSEQAEHESFLAGLHQVVDTSSSARLTVLTSDVITCLARVNIELNGAAPSSSTTGYQRPEVIGEAAPSVAGILSAGLERLVREPANDTLSRSLWRIAVAWDLVLAGDIDDLVREVDLAMRAAV